MTRKSILTKIMHYICRKGIILFAPQTLSTLHLASLYENKKTEEKKQLENLSRKMEKIVTKFPKKSLNKHIEKNIELLDSAYNKKDSLTLKELKTLRNFCYLLKKEDIVAKEEKISIDEKYNKIEAYYIEKKKQKKKDKEIQTFKSVIK